MSLWAGATVGMNNLGVCPFFFTTQYLFSLLSGRKYSYAAGCVRISDTLLDAFSSETALWLVASNLCAFFFFFVFHWEVCRCTG